MFNLNHNNTSMRLKNDSGNSLDNFICAVEHFVQNWCGNES